MALRVEVHLARLRAAIEESRRARMELRAALESTPTLK